MRPRSTEGGELSHLHPSLHPKANSVDLTQTSLLSASRARVHSQPLPDLQRVQKRGQSAPISWQIASSVLPTSHLTEECGPWLAQEH